MSVEWFFGCEFGQDWQEERPDFRHETHELIFGFSESAAPNECTPL